MPCLVTFSANVTEGRVSNEGGVARAAGGARVDDATADMRPAVAADFARGAGSFHACEDTARRIATKTVRSMDGTELQR